MKRGFLLFSMAALAAFSQQQESGVVFRSDVSLVRVDAQVLDSSGRAVTGLTRSDFILREQGAEREIRNFQSEDLPLDVLILVDVSTSMRPNVEKVAAASQDALSVLGQDDRVAMMVFDRSTRLRLPFRSAQSQEVRGEFGRLLNHEHFSGGTDITRALYDGANYVKRNGRQGVRRAIVILTDDQTEFNRDEDGVVHQMTQADAVVSLLLAPDVMGQFGGRQYPGAGGGTYPRRGGGGIGGGLGDILLGGGRYPGGGYPGGGGGYPRGGGRYPGGGGGGYPGGGGRMSGTQSAGTREIAQRTGGDTIQIDDASALETTLSKLRQRYALYFTVPDGVRAGAERYISVDLSNSARRRYPNAEVRYRKNYIVPEGTAVSSAQPNDPAPVVVSSTGSSVPSSSSSSSSDASSSDDQRPAIRRRPAVNERSGPSGPSVGPAPTVSAKPEATSDSAPAPVAADHAPTAPAEKKGGWRRANSDDLKP